MLANQICLYTTRKPGPIVGELASSPMDGTGDWARRAALVPVAAPVEEGG